MVGFPFMDPPQECFSAAHVAHVSFEMVVFSLSTPPTRENSLRTLYQLGSRTYKITRNSRLQFKTKHGTIAKAKQPYEAQRSRQCGCARTNKHARKRAHMHTHTHTLSNTCILALIYLFASTHTCSEIHIHTNAHKYAHCLTHTYQILIILRNFDLLLHCSSKLIFSVQ